MTKTIEAIHQTEQEIAGDQNEWGSSLMSLHVKMT